MYVWANIIVLPANLVLVPVVSVINIIAIITNVFGKTVPTMT